MSSNISKYQAQAEKFKARASSLARRYREEAEGVAETGIGLAAAAAFGAIDAKYGTDALMGASVPLIAGAVFTGAALMGYGGGMSSTVLAVGRAGLSVEAYRWGANTYQEWSTANPPAA